MFVYIIKGTNINNKTKHYIGFTVNINRRLRQHNRELVGGAKSTCGYNWSYIGFISDITTMQLGLQIEWRLKHVTKKHNIIDKINSFINYINLNNKASPNGSDFDKLSFYLIDELSNQVNKSDHFVIKSLNNYVF